MEKRRLHFPLAGALVVAFSYIGMSSCDSPGTLGVTGTGGRSSGGGTGGNNTINLNQGGAAGTPTKKGGNSGSPGSTPTTSGCGTTIVNTQRAQADVLIVLDRTDSMKWSITSDNDCQQQGGGGRDHGPPGGTTTSCTTRVDVVVPAVGSVVELNPGINWGLEFFTTPNSSGYCTVDSKPQVEVKPGSAAEIKQWLSNYSTQLSTPTAKAIDVATAYLKTVSDSNNKVILLATDGLPNCAASSKDWNTEDMPGTITAITSAKSAGFPVYVIGIGPQTSVTNMNNMAAAGGTGQYFPATSTEELNTALNSIAKVVSATCNFKSNSVPPDKDLVYVYVDKSLVQKGQGWSFDESDPTGSSIVLTGSTCDDMMSGKTSQVQIVFGCPGAIPDQIIP
jgi:hypothetical protein